MPSVIITLDGPVFIDLFKLRDTYGVPLSAVMSWCKEKPMLFSVPHFIIDANMAGWKREKVLSELREAWLMFLPRKDVDELIGYMEVFLTS